MKKNELYHHGIKGQKWGERNGPPYPLDPSEYSALEKKHQARKSLKGQKLFVKRSAELSMDRNVDLKTAFEIEEKYAKLLAGLSIGAIVATNMSQAIPYMTPGKYLAGSALAFGGTIAISHFYRENLIKKAGGLSRKQAKENRKKEEWVAKQEALKNKKK